MKTPRFAKGRAAARLRPEVDKSQWPDPPMVPSYALRRCEEAKTIEEVRAIVAQFLSAPKARVVNTDGNHC